VCNHLLRRDLGAYSMGNHVTATAAIQFTDLTLGYDPAPAVHHLDGEIREGALIALIGPNGWPSPS
jgi:hypothetical protein